MSAPIRVKRAQPSFTAALPSLALVAFVVAAFVVPAQAMDRDVPLRFLPPNDAPITGYQVYVTDDATQIEQVVDVGFVSPGSDGVARTTVVLESERAYDVGMTAYNDFGESEISNRIFVAADGPVCEAALCDDDDPCTADSCAAGVCVSTALDEGSSCDDGFDDTFDDRCEQGVCRGVLLVCRDDLDCDDGNVCNGIEVCDGGSVCLEGSPPNCGVATDCTVPRCDAREGCWTDFRPDDTECNDGLAENQTGVCREGVCLAVDVPPPAPDATPLAIEAVSPSVVSHGRHTITIHGSGFTDGASVSFHNGEGRPPRVRTLRVLDDATLELRVRTRSRRRASVWDVFVTLPDGREVGLREALRIER